MKNNTKKVECAGGIIFNQKNEVVIVNQNHDSWSLPKGRIDEGETPIAAKSLVAQNIALNAINFSLKNIGQCTP